MSAAPKNQTTKHAATFDGHTFTRTSKTRVYTHAVIVAYDIEVERARTAQFARDSFKANRSYYEKLANDPVYVGKFGNGQTYTKEISDSERAGARAWLDLGEDGHAKKAVEGFDKSLTGCELSSDGTSYYGVAGWCGRADLARKLAAQSSRRTHIVEAVLL